MNFKSNAKINQVTETTLVVGIDIAKRKHYATFTDERGRELEKAFPIKQTMDGFEALYQAIREGLRTFSKTDVIVGVEPTGHYWLNLAYFLEDRGIPLVVVNPSHVKQIKELDDNLQTKNDKKDSLTIARLMKDGRFSKPKLLRELEAEIRVVYNQRESLILERTAIKNKLHRWIDKYFPELFDVFRDFSAMMLAVLEEGLLQADLALMNSDELATLCATGERMKQRRPKKAAEIIHVARSSIGITEAPEGAQREITFLMRQYRLFEDQIDELDQVLADLVRQTADYEYLASVPGLGETTIAGILAEVGSLNDYESPRQLIKLAGLTLRENSSGNHQGQKRISKRGRKRLRTLLFKSILPLIQNNEAFRKQFKYYTTRPDNPLKGKQSMVVLCGKLIKIMHALCKKRRFFDAEQMISDMTCLHTVS